MSGGPSTQDNEGSMSLSDRKKKLVSKKRKGSRKPALPSARHSGRHKRMEHALLASEVRYRRLFESAQDGILILDAESGSITDVNPFLVNLLGRARGQFMGKQLWEIGLFRDVGKSKAAFQELQRTGYIRYENLPLETRDGRRIDVEFVSNIYKEGGTRVIQCNIRDITLRKHAEMEKAILESSELEQRRIGQELHDGLCQQLTGVALLSEALEGKLAAHLPVEAADLSEITDLINQAIDQTRDLARGLSPVEIEVAGLVPALHKFAIATERFFDISCVFTYDASSQFQHPKMPSLSTHLYRIAQEAVSNAIQHGKAKHVVIGLTTVRNRGVLTIRDDGSGIPTDTEDKQGLGLRSMRYRAGMIHASLDVRRDLDGGGTIVTCSFPLHSGGGGVGLPGHEEIDETVRREGQAGNRFHCG